MNQDFHYHGANWTGAGWSAECRVLMAFVGGGLIGYGLSQKAPAACILGTLGLALAAEAGANLGVEDIKQGASALADKAGFDMGRHQVGEMAGATT